MRKRLLVGQIVVGRDEPSAIPMVVPGSTALPATRGRRQVRWVLAASGTDPALVSGRTQRHAPASHEENAGALLGASRTAGGGAERNEPAR